MIEMLIVLIFMGILMSIATPRVRIFLEEARATRAIGDIKTIQVDLMKYYTSADSFPPSLASIGDAGILDPWGQPYLYTRFGATPPGSARVDQFGVPINTAFDLYSVGQDGASSPSLLAGASQDDVVLGNDGGFIGKATRY